MASTVMGYMWLPFKEARGSRYLLVMALGPKGHLRCLEALNSKVSRPSRASREECLQVRQPEAAWPWPAKPKSLARLDPHGRHERSFTIAVMIVSTIITCITTLQVTQIEQPVALPVQPNGRTFKAVLAGKGLQAVAGKLSGLALACRPVES